MRKKIFAAFIIGTMLLFSVFACKSGVHKSVTGVSVHKNPDKTVYALNEEFKIDGGQILVEYSDSATEYIDMTVEMYTVADTSSVGDKSLTLGFTVADSPQTLEINYRVVFSVAVDEFVTAMNAVPLLNELSAADADSIIAAREMLDGLQTEDLDFATQNHANLIARLNQSENRILTDYYKLRYDLIIRFADGLNAGGYTDGNFETILAYRDSFTAAKNLTSLRGIAEAAETFYSNVNAVPKLTDTPGYSLDMHKAATVAALQKIMKANFYSVRINDADPMGSSSVAAQEYDFSGNPAVAGTYDAFTARINSAGSVADVDETYSANIAELNGVFIVAYAQTAGDSLNGMAAAWRSTISAQLERLGNATQIGVNGSYDGIGVNYFEGDNRWWIPEPLKIPNILASYASKFKSSAALSRSRIIGYYERYYFELLRAVMQRNIEMFHAIEQQDNPDYNAINGGLYWSKIGDYNSDNSGVFTYDGVMDEYYGQKFNEYRLSGTLHNSSAGSTVEGLVTNYNLMMNANIKPATVVSATLHLAPKKTVFRQNETVTVVGGRIKLTYTNSYETVISMTDSMFNTSAAPTNVVGTSLPLTLEFAVPGNSGLQLTIYYSVSAFGDPEEILNEADIFIETANFYDYSVANQTAINGLYAAFKSDFKNAPTDEAKNQVVNDFYTGFAAIATLSDDNDLVAYKANTLLSIDRIAGELPLYTFASTAADNCSVTPASVSLKEHANVKAKYDEFVAAVNDAPSMEALREMYGEKAAELHGLIVAAYQTTALTNVKTLFNSFMESISAILDTATIPASTIGGQPAPPIDRIRDRTRDDIWEYHWYTPMPFRVSVMYDGIKIEGAVTKAEASKLYEAVYIDMLRCVMFRNVYTVNMIYAQDRIWNISCEYNGDSTYEYDGVLDGYSTVGSYRLWKPAFDPATKRTTVAELIFEYNYAIGIMIPN
ncbi:MAG: hypothetical protein LBP26_02250 [Clostridiales bacterium]|jgi:hypothetical protein|nr:hypothetical protein [Clostridiales bacterium]